MSLWRKRNNVSHDGQNRPKLFTMNATTDNHLSIKSDDLSIKSDDLSIKQSKEIEMSKEALKLALEWIEKQPEETPDSKYDVDTRYVVIREIEAALAQQRTWVGLTDEDEIDWEEGGNLKDLVKAIEAKLKEKNT